MFFTEFNAATGVMPIATPTDSPGIGWPDLPPPQKLTSSLAAGAGLDFAWPDLPPPQK